MFQDLGEFVFKSHYAQVNPDTKKAETWVEAVHRVMQMHRKKYADKNIESELQVAETMMGEKRVLGSQRALQFAGPPILQKNARIYNCAATYIDRPQAFSHITWLLLCGVGVGFSVQKHHIAKLPAVRKPTGDEEECVFVVPDTIEGWADACGVLLSTIFETDQAFPEFFGKKVRFDFSLIRPEGSRISCINGKAPGPDPLRKSLAKIAALIQEITGPKLQPIEAYDILMFMADAVLAGGVRRSATLTIFSEDDDAMMNAKTGNWFLTRPERARSNNSVMYMRESLTEEKLWQACQKMQEFGEPGVILSDSLEAIFNPCVPGDTWVVTASGRRQVYDLLNKPFTAVVDGEHHECKTGFVRTGTKPVFTLSTLEGLQITATANHKFLTSTGDWVPLGDLQPGTKLRIHDHTQLVGSLGDMNRESMIGWLVGTVASAGQWHAGKWQVAFSGRDAKQLDAVTAYFIASTRVPSLEDCVRPYLRIDGTFCLDLEKESLTFLQGFLSAWIECRLDMKTLFLPVRTLQEQATIQRLLLVFGVTTLSVVDTMVLYLPPSSITRVCCVLHIQGYHNYLKVSKRRRLWEPVAPREVTVKSRQLVGNRDVYDCTVDGAHAFDANGFWVHNCVEVGLSAYDEKGNSGFETCNLSEINMKLVRTEDDFYTACRAASIIGTLQAGYTDFPYLGPATENIIRREALLGVSMTGMMDRPDIAFDPRILRTGAAIVRRTNQLLARKLGIRPSARTTCVKPAGSTSCILGTASGIHPHHARHYFRRVQVNERDPNLAHMARANPQAIEDSVWSTGNTDKVITFCCEVPATALTKLAVRDLALLEKVKLVQQNWVVPGKDPARCTQPWLSHNVSNTINVDAGNWKPVMHYVLQNKQDFTGLSFLGTSGDLDYPQAPFQRVLMETEIVATYGRGALFISGLVVHALTAFDQSLHAACQYLITATDFQTHVADTNPQHTDSHTIREVKEKINKQLWATQAKQFADRYFTGDLKRLTYCMKHVDALKTWTDIRRNYQPVQWDELEMAEGEQPSSTQLPIACSGGGCEIIRV